MNYLEKRTVICAKYLVKNSSTVRKTANKFNLSKSTLHSDIHKRLPYVNKPLYEKVVKILETNYKEKHIRGGESTKNKYKHTR